MTKLDCKESSLFELSTYLVYGRKNFFFAGDCINITYACVCNLQEKELTKNLLTTSRYYANQRSNDKLVGESILPENWLYLQLSIDFCRAFALTLAHTFIKIHRLESNTVHDMGLQRIHFF